MSAAAEKGEEPKEEEQEDPAALRGQLVALRAKMSSWKRSVKSQLEDAAAKNTTLRRELATACEQRDAAAASTRLALTAEFKDRLQLKDGEIGTLTARLQQQARENEAALRDTRERADAALAQRDEMHAAALQRAVDDAAAAAAQREAQLRATAAEHETRAADLAHALAVERTRVAAMEKQLRERSDTTAEATRASAGELAALRTAAEQSAAESRRATEELRAVQERARAEREQAAREFEHQLAEEVHRRDEQLQVLQAVLRRAQAETEALHRRLDDSRGDVAAAEDRAARRVSALTADVLAKMERVAALEAEVSQQRADGDSLRHLVAELRAEAEIREATFDDVVAGGATRELMLRLERELEDAVEQRNDLRARLHAAERAAAAAAAERDEVALQCESRAAALDQRDATMAARAERLRTQEAKLQALQRQLAAMARTASSSAPAAGGAPSCAGGGSAANDDDEGRHADGDVEANTSQSTGNAAAAASPTAERSPSTASLDIDPELAAMARRAAIGGGGGGTMAESVLTIQRHYDRLVGPRAAAASGSFFRRYRQLMPVLIVFALLSFTVYWWSFGASTSGVGGDASLRRFAEMSEELRALQREYSNALGAMKRCGCTLAPSGAEQSGVAPSQ